MKGRKKKLVKKDADSHSNVAKDYTTYTKNELIKELQKIKKQKKYGLVWEDHPEDVANVLKNKLPVLFKDESMSMEGQSSNILIEGDNYHVLSILNYTHKEMIDVIYIDPPYNTGNDDAFKFNDKLVDKEDTYKHSKWLSYIQKRLILARKILKKNGIIFISIDEHEESQLKLLTDEIFGNENFISKLIWKKKYTGGKHASFFVDLHEYILVYAKNKQLHTGFEMNRPESEKIKFNMEDSYVKKRGKFYIRPLKSNLELRPTLIYDIKLPDQTKINTQWIVSKTTFEKLLNEKRILFKKKRDGKYQVYMKYYEKDRSGKVKIPSILDFTYNNEAKIELKNIFNIREGRDNVFYTVKPLKLIKFLIEISTQNNSDCTVLDFMAGSGTTAHAVLELNKDGGNRKFILCTNNENNICTDVCYPRIKKVINGYKNLKNEKVKGLGGGLRYFRTGFVDAIPTDANKKRLVDHSTGILCLKEGCFDKIIATKHYAMFTDGHKTFAIVYGDEGIIPVKKAIVKRRQKCLVYVFSLDEYDKAEEFEQVSHLVTLKPIPASILNLYRRLFK